MRVQDISAADITVAELKEETTMGEMPALTEAVYYILLALMQPMHGYGIMQTVAEMSNGRVRLAAGTLYGALTNLCGKGWIRELPDQAAGRKKEYCITPAGIAVVQQELTRLQELVANGEKQLGN
jgi:DNA-binding PadR family transcriptional regulator